MPNFLTHHLFVQDIYLKNNDKIDFKENIDSIYTSTETIEKFVHKINTTDLSEPQTRIMKKSFKKSSKS